MYNGYRDYRNNFHRIQPLRNMCISTIVIWPSIMEMSLYFIHQITCAFHWNTQLCIEYWCTRVFWPSRYMCVSGILIANVKIWLLTLDGYIVHSIYCNHSCQVLNTRTRCYDRQEDKLCFMFVKHRLPDHLQHWMRDCRDWVNGWVKIWLNRFRGNCSQRL